MVTDIVFLRKRDRGEAAHHVDPDWLGIAPLEIDGAEVPVNRYFLNHPEMVLGNWTRKDTLYGGEGYSVTGNGDLAGQLKEAIHRLPEYAPFQFSTGLSRVSRPGTTSVTLPESLRMASCRNVWIMPTESRPFTSSGRGRQRAPS